MDALNVVAPDVERARATLGTNSRANYEVVSRVIQLHHGRGGSLLDIGCGKGTLWHYVHHYFGSYLGVDAISYPEFPSAATFHLVNLNSQMVPLPDNSADVVASVGVIEYLENPRAFMREVARLVKPGGLVIVTTQNQLSWLSKISLLLRNRFAGFPPEGPWSQAITALLESDLVRIARECRLNDIRLQYNDHGRIPWTNQSWPRCWLFRGRRFSDTVVLVATKNLAP